MHCAKPGQRPGSKEELDTDGLSYAYIDVWAIKDSESQCQWQHKSNLE